MTRTKLYAGISIVGILVASAAGAAYKSVPRNTLCEGKDFYATHEKECNSYSFLSPFSYRKHDRAPRAEYGGFSSYEQRQQVTVVSDPQAVSDGGNRGNTPYIVTQTGRNIAASGGYGDQAYGYGWPRAADAGVGYVPAPAYAYARPHAYAYRRHVHRHVTTRHYVDFDSRGNIAR